MSIVFISPLLSRIIVSHVAVLCYSCYLWLYVSLVVPTHVIYADIDHGTRQVMRLTTHATASSYLSFVQYLFFRDCSVLVIVFLFTSTPHSLSIFNDPNAIISAVSHRFNVRLQPCIRHQLASPHVRHLSASPVLIIQPRRLYMLSIACDVFILFSI